MIEFGCIDLERGKKDSQGMQMLWLSDEMEMILQARRPVALGYEDIVFHGPNAGICAAHMYGAIKMRILEICERNKIPAYGLTPSTARKLAVGRGDVNKRETAKVLCARFGLNLRGLKGADDITDSIAVAVAVAVRLRLVVPAMWEGGKTRRQIKAEKKRLAKKNQRRNPDGSLRY